MSKIKSLLAVTMTAAMALTGISVAHATSSTITLATAGSPTSLAVTSSSYGNLVHYYQALYDTVLHMDATGKIGPGLATKWTYNSDRTSLKISLRTGLVFSNGDRLDANAVVANLNRFKASSNGSANFFKSISSISISSAIDFTINLSAPDPALLNYLAWNSSLIEDPASFGAKDEATNPIGSGPYTLDLKRTTTGTVYTFVRNPKYWNKSAAQWDTLILKAYSDPVALVNALQAGQVQGGKLINNDGVAQLQGAGLEMTFNQIDWSGLVISDRAGKLGSPLKDVRVRRAIEYAFNRDAMLKVANGGWGTPTTQIFNPSGVGFQSALDKAYPYNVAKAKALLAEAGYAKGFTLELPSLAAYYGATVYEAIVSQLKDVGITVVLKETAIANYAAARGKYPIVFVNAEMSANPWQLASFAMTPSAQFNFEGYSDPAANVIFSKLQNATSVAAIAKAAKELNAYVVDQAWFVPWYSKKVPFAHTSAVNVKPQAGNVVPFLYNMTAGK